MPQEMPEDERRVLTAQLVAVDPFRELSATFTLQMYHAFCMIAADEGKSISEYAQRGGVSTAVMSRHVLDLSVRRRTGEKGFGLLMTRPNPVEMRQHQVFLTPVGRAYAHKVVRALNLR
jgi:DNA-binding MarR family transcriptional regulator